MITNDFISRIDLYPWICAVYVDPDHHGNADGRARIDNAGKDARTSGFQNVYLYTDQIGYYYR